MVIAVLKKTLDPFVVSGQTNFVRGFEIALYSLQTLKKQKRFFFWKETIPTLKAVEGFRVHIEALIAQTGPYGL